MLQFVKTTPHQIDVTQDLINLSCETDFGLNCSSCHQSTQSPHTHTYTLAVNDAADHNG